MHYLSLDESYQKHHDTLVPMNGSPRSSEGIDQKMSLNASQQVLKRDKEENPLLPVSNAVSQENYVQERVQMKKIQETQTIKKNQSILVNASGHKLVETSPIDFASNSGIEHTACHEHRFHENPLVNSSLEENPQGAVSPNSGRGLPHNSGQSQGPGPNDWALPSAKNINKSTRVNNQNTTLPYDTVYNTDADIATPLTEMTTPGSRQDFIGTINNMNNKYPQPQLTSDPTIPWATKTSTSPENQTQNYQVHVPHSRCRLVDRKHHKDQQQNFSPIHTNLNDISQQLNLGNQTPTLTSPEPSTIMFMSPEAPPVDSITIANHYNQYNNNSIYPKIQDLQHESEESLQNKALGIIEVPKDDRIRSPKESKKDKLRAIAQKRDKVKDGSISRPVSRPGSRAARRILD